MFSTSLMQHPLVRTAIAGSILTASTAVMAAQDKGSINLAYVEWSSEIASTNVVRTVLENEGFDVEMSSLSAAAMWQAVASGDADAMVSAWLPTTHENYYKRLKGKLDNLGANLEGTQLGLVVPDYVKDVNSIDELNAHADEFDGQIIGIDPGAGLMEKTESVMKTYDLSDMTLISGSGATMTAALANAIKNETPIVVTGWTPHWMFARWDLHYLEDPRGVYGGSEEIDTITRKGLREDMPEATCILDQFHWTPADMNDVMLMNQKEGSDPYDNAKEWVSEHQDKVSEWTKGCVRS